MLTVGDLLRLPKLATRSITPGTGESRAVSWAHVCELSDPWAWIGGRALVMTTGLAVPVSPDEQCSYIEGMHAGGIAAITIGENMSAPPLSAAMLTRAVELDFPILETAHDTPFITLATAVAEAQSRDRQARIQLTERLYLTLREHLNESEEHENNPEGLLAELSRLLGGELRIVANSIAGSGSSSPRGRVTPHGDGSFTIPLPGSPGDELQLTAGAHPAPDFSVLQHTAAIVSGALAARAASNRQRQLHGSILLGNLLDGALAAESAIDLLNGYGIAAPFALATWNNLSGASGLERAQRRLDAAEIPNLLTEKSGQLYLLTTETGILTRACEELAAKAGPIALSDAFPRIEDIAAARRLNGLVLAEADPASCELLRPSDRAPRSPFFPAASAARADAIAEVLGALLDHDRERNTELLHTLHVFLSEDRSWLRAAERLFMHRQTLVSRIARIEQITGNKIVRTQDSSTLWFALQCAVEEGVIAPLEPRR